jgi:hypothetical protein
MTGKYELTGTNVRDWEEGNREGIKEGWRTLYSDKRRQER